MADNQAILKVSMADEADFAAIAAGTGKPAVSALTFEEITFESAEFEPQPVQQDRTPTRCSTAEMPPDAGESRDSSGTPYELIRGKLKLKVYIDNVGSSGLQVTDLVSYKLLRTLLLDDPPPSATSNITTASSETRITPAGAADWEYGSIVAFEHNGRRVSTRCTGLDGAEKILSPALLGTPANGTVARFFRQLYSKGSWSSVTKAFRLEGYGMRWHLLGCATEDFTIETVSTGGLMLTVGMQIAQAEADHASADPTCNGTGNSGLVRPNWLNCYHSMSSQYSGEGGTLVEPAESPRLGIQPEGFKISVAVPTTPDAFTENAIGMRGWRRAGGLTGNIEIPMCTTEASAFATDRPFKARRQLHLNAGPHQAGQGFTAAFGGVFHRTPPTIRERAPDIWRQKLSLGVGPYTADQNTGAAAASVDWDICLGWSL